MLSKPKLFLYGGCDLFDISRSVILKREFDVISSGMKDQVIDETTLNFSQCSFPGEGRSLASLYTPSGLIGLRCLEHLERLPPEQKKASAGLYKEILKFPILDYYKKHAGKNDYLLLSFSAELYTKFHNFQECFTISPPAFRNITKKNHPFYWLYEEYLSKDDLMMPFDARESLNWTSDLIQEFAKDIYEIFKDRVIIVATHFSNFVITSDHTIKKHQPSAHEILFYKQSKIVHDPLDHHYVEKCSDIIANKFVRRYKTSVPIVKLNDPVFLDANHRWGLGQFHIDTLSRAKIAEQIYRELVKHLNKNNEQTDYID